MAPTKSQAINAAATLAILAATFGPVAAVPFGIDGELAARGPNGSKMVGNAVKEVYNAVGQNTLHDKVKKATHRETKIPQGLKNAAALAAKPKDPKLVAAVIGSKSGGRKRDLADLLDDLLEARDYDEIDDLLARGPDGSEIAGNGATEVGSAAGRNGPRRKFKFPQSGPRGKHSKPAGRKSVAGRRPSVSALRSGSEKRDLADMVDDILEARDYDEIDDLFVRGPDGSEITGSGATEISGAAGRTGPRRKVKFPHSGPRGKYSKPAGRKSVAGRRPSVSTLKSGSEKRDLADMVDDLLEARDYDEIDDLFARGPDGSEITGNGATEISGATGRTGPRRKVKSPHSGPRGKYSKPAGRKSVAGRRPRISQLKSGSEKRDLADVVDDLLEARDYADEIEDLAAREYDGLVDMLEAREMSFGELEELD